MADLPTYRVKFMVTAYDAGGYGDDRSKEFTDGQSAVDYAKGLEPRFGAVVTKVTTMDPLREHIPLETNP